MKKCLKVLMLLLSVVTLFAQSGFRIVDTYQVGPGSHYTYYRNDAKPWDVYVTTIDLNNPYIKLESVKSQDRLAGFETPSSMSRRMDTENHRSVCAINGDFYNTSNGVPISTHVVNGQYLHYPGGIRKGIAYSDIGKADIFVPSFSGVVIADNDTSFHNLRAVNGTRSTNYLCIYNHYYGSSTGTNQYGFECLVDPITDWTINDTVYGVIETREDGIGNMSIPAGKIVLSGHGTADSFLSSYCQTGDTVRIVQRMDASDLEDITQFVGGGPQMLSNGIDVTASNTEGISSSFYAVRHPRTAVGFNADSTLVYFVVVDGRSSNSIGMTLHEMAAFMHSIGAQHAVNLDGGGSSSFVVRNGVMNDPSDGSERSVANSMLCVSTAPNGTLTYVQCKKDSIAVYKNKTVSTEFSGWDEYYNPATINDWSSISVNYNTSMGAYSENTFTANESEGDTYITAEYNGNIDSVLVHIIELYDLDIYPDTVVTDSVRTIDFTTRARDENDITTTMDNDIFEYSVLEPAIGEINANGEFTGKSNGLAHVVTRYGEETDTAIVRVEIGSGEIVVDELESLDGWTVTTDEYINAAQTSVVLADNETPTGSKAFQVNYSRTGDEDGNIYIETEPTDIYGVPTFMLIDVESDGFGHWIYIMFEDARGVEYSVKSSSSLRYSDEYRAQYMDMERLLPADGDQLYPLKLKGIRLRIDEDATVGTLYLDRIRLTYAGWTAIGEHDNTLIPSAHELDQNYPNPFNPVTVISYKLSKVSDVDLSVFDINGRKVATLVSGMQESGSYTVNFDASAVPGGIYFYRLQADGWTDTKKMLLIK